MKNPFTQEINIFEKLNLNYEWDISKNTASFKTILNDMVFKMEVEIQLLGHPLAAAFGCVRFFINDYPVDVWRITEKGIIEIKSTILTQPIKKVIAVK